MEEDYGTNPMALEKNLYLSYDGRKIHLKIGRNKCYAGNT